MNCDDFPALYESDDAHERRFAEDHADGCPHCRETLRIIGLVQEELSPITPPANLRVASRQVRPIPPRRSERFAVAAMAACLALVAAFVVVNDSANRNRNTVDSLPQVQPDAEIVRVVQDDSQLRFDALESELDLLSQRLDTIALHAVLLEERNDLAQLTKQSQ